MKLDLKLIAQKVLTTTGTDYENGNMGHRPGIKGGYFPVPPVDSCTRYERRIFKSS